VPYKDGCKALNGACLGNGYPPTLELTSARPIGWILFYHHQQSTHFVQHFSNVLAPIQAQVGFFLNIFVDEIDSLIDVSQPP